MISLAVFSYVDVQSQQLCDGKSLLQRHPLQFPLVLRMIPCDRAVSVFSILICACE
jgi:hypothetical protein